MSRRHPYCLVICKICHRILGLEYWNTIYKNLDESEKTYDKGRNVSISHKCREKNKRYARMIQRYWNEMWRITFPRHAKAVVPKELKKYLPRIRN